MSAAEARRRLSELHARHASNLHRWQRDQMEFQTERASIQEACEHENVSESAAQYQVIRTCRDCGKTLEALVS